MINLPNGCSCSNLSVFPKNWKSKNAKVLIDWYIIYRFYDPRFKKPKQVKVKRMNSFKALLERQVATLKALDREMIRLTIEAFNPFDKIEEGQKTVPQEALKSDDSTNSETSVLTALRLAFEGVSVSAITKKDIKFSLFQIENAVKELKLDAYSISQVSKKHVKQILETASNTPDRFNKNRSYLMILYSELSEMELVQSNIVKDIKKKKVVNRLRKVLTDEERKLVNKYLLVSYPEFHRFLHIFFHSGVRISELLRVNETDVDLINQRYKVIIQKGRIAREAWRTIKDIALPYWKEIMNECKKDQYPFSVGLKPGNVQIQPYQIGKRWYRLVKKKLGIQADFYSLKHLHTTEVVDLLNEVEAAKHNEHTSTAMVIGIYDVKRSEREHNKVKKLDNKFA